MVATRFIILLIRRRNSKASGERLLPRKEALDHYAFAHLSLAVEVKQGLHGI